MRATRALLATFALLIACACAGGQPTTTSQPPATEPAPSPAPPPAPPEPECGGKTCTPPEQCIRYYGIAGPSLPLFTCGQPCTEQGECPAGLSCATIADGPRLCR